ncbi:MAG: SPOR domain-containing protein [Ignavibacteriales bacterium]|nr:SPOR domain-containing protein [Ignavibacteriales bacterium]
MPDLNLIDDAETGESTSPEQPEPKGGGGGVSYTTHIIIIVVVSIVLGGGYFMWKKGIFPFKKKQPPVVAQVQEETFPQEPSAQAGDQSKAQTQAQADSSEIALLETPLPEDNATVKKEGVAGKPPAGTKEEAKAGAKKESKTDAKSEASTASEHLSKLSDMKGEFTVQVVSFKEKQRAEDAVKNLEFSGYPAFMENVSMKGGDWWAVRIGKYATHAEAKKSVESFGAQLRADYVITRVREK